MVRPPHAGRGGARKPGLEPALAELWTRPGGLCGAASGTCPQRLDTGRGMDPEASPAQGVLQVPRGRAFTGARPKGLTPEVDQLDDYKRCSVLQKQPGTGGCWRGRQASLGREKHPAKSGRNSTGRGQQVPGSVGRECGVRDEVAGGLGSDLQARV